MPDNTHSKRRRRFGVGFVVGVAVLVVLTATGVFVWKYVVGGLERTERSTDTVTEPFTRLEVDGGAGRVEVVEAAGDRTVVETELRWRADYKPGHTQKITGDTLRLKDTGCRREFDFAQGCSVSWRIEVPPEVELDVSVDSGAIKTTGVKGAQRLHTDSGVIEVDDPGEKLTVASDSGIVEGTRLPGTDVDITMDSGLIELDFTKAPGDVVIGNDSGEIDVRVPETDDGYDIETRSDSGAADVEVADIPESDRTIAITTDSGRISVEYARP